MAGNNESSNYMAGSLRRVWRNAGTPSDGGSGTYANIAEKGDLLIDTTNAKLYQNTNTQASPTWEEKASSSGVSLETNVANMAAAGTATSNTIGDGTKAAPANHVHALGAHDHSGSTTGGDLGDVTAKYVVLSNTTAPAGTSCYICRDNTGDLTLNALTGKEIHLAIAGTDVLDIGTIVEIISGGLTITAGGLTVAADGALITGNSTITGDLEVTGSLTFGGNWTVAATLTVDELILDTDGSAPAATACYAVRDNSGDLTVNAVSGKQFIVAIAGTDEYTFSATVLDMNANALDNCGFVILNAATPPAGTEVYLVNDNTGDLTLNALTGKEVHIAINGTDEYDFNATAFQIAAANNIQFLGDNGILDSSGNKVIMVTAVGSAVNYLNVRNAATANPIILECLGTADRGFEFHNDQNEQILCLTPVASATVELTILNAATGGQPILRVTGEADRGLEIQNADGEVECEFVSVATAVNWLSISNAATGNKPIILSAGEDDIGMEFQAKNAEPMLSLTAVAAAKDYIVITSAVTTEAPSITVAGDTDHIDLSLAGKGNGYVRIDANMDMSDNTIYGSAAADGNLLLASTYNATKGFVGIPTGNEGLKIGGTADRAGAVGDNALHIFNGAAAPAGALANGISLYSEGGECKVLDAAGNSTTLSPHTADGDYVIHSFAAGKEATVTIHLEKLVNALIAKDSSLAKYVTLEAGHIKKPKNVK